MAIRNKTANKITKVLRAPTHNSSETITNETENIEHDKEIPKEINTSPEKDRKLLMI